MEKNIRSNFIDNLKGLAIILVVFGHCIQMSNGAEYINAAAFYDNKLFSFIYGFHMPIFMIISGYLFKLSFDRKNIYQILLGRFHSLLIPIVFWAITDFFIKSYVNTPSGASAIYYLKSLASSFVYNLWFLWAIIYCSIITSFIYKRRRYRAAILSLVFLAMFITPDSLNFHTYKFMFLYFIIPFSINEFNLESSLEKIDIKLHATLTIIALLIYIFITYSWSRELYIYTTRFSLLNKELSHQLYIDIYRWFAGLLGIFVVVSAFQLISRLRLNMNTSILSAIGKKSLGIYIFSSLIFTYLIPSITKQFTFNWSTTIFISVAILFSTLIMTHVASRFKITNQLMLGGRKIE